MGVGVGGAGGKVWSQRWAGGRFNTSRRSGPGAAADLGACVARGWAVHVGARLLFISLVLRRVLCGQFFCA